MELFKIISGSEATIFEEGQLINNASSIMWTERYRDPGEFEIVAQLSSGLREFLPIGTFISHTDTAEVMIVENHEISEEHMEDPVLTITGRSMESYLENRIVGMNQARGSYSVGEYIIGSEYTWLQAVTLINDHINDTTNVGDNLPNVIAMSNLTTGVVQDEISFKRENAHKAMLNILAMEDLGIKVLRRNTVGFPDSGFGETRWCVYKGENKSASVIFSWKAGDIESAEYLFSNKKLKNSVVVMGRYINVVVDTPGVIKYNRRSMTIDADDIDGAYETAPTGTALTAVVNKMRARGKLVLKSQLNVTITRSDLASISKYQYRRDFNVGDFISLDGNFGQIAVMRVIEYVEIQDENGESGHPTLAIPGE